MSIKNARLPCCVFEMKQDSAAKVVSLMGGVVIRGNHR